MLRFCAGFVRLAMQQNANVVPVLCLGELSTLRNFIDLPRMQVRITLAELTSSAASIAPISAPALERAHPVAWPYS